MVWNFSDTNKFNWISNFRKINMIASKFLTDYASDSTEAPDYVSLKDAYNYEHPTI